MSPRSLLLAAALAAPALFPAAQAQTTFGVRAGLNVSDFSGDTEIIGNTDPRLGFSGGVFANVPIGYSGAYVQPEVLYSMKGAKDGNDNSDGTIQLDYVEVPILLGFATPVTDSGLTVGGYLGPALAFKVRESFSGGSGLVVNGPDVFKDTDIGAAAGVTVGAGPFGIDGRYTYGLGNVLDQNEAGVHNAVFTIAATYRFGAGSTARRRGSRY